MGTRIYVGNLSYGTAEGDLRQHFEAAGCTVTAVHVVTDRETGRPRGFAFVEVADGEQLATAIRTLDGQELDGRRLAVSEARPRQPAGGDGGAPRSRGFGGNGAGAGSGGGDRPRSNAPERSYVRGGGGGFGGGGGGFGGGGFGAGGFGGPDDGFEPPPEDGRGRKKRNKLRPSRHAGDEDSGGRGGGRPRGGKRRGRGDDFDY